MKILFPIHHSVRNEGAFALLADLAGKTSLTIHLIQSYLKPQSISEVPYELWEKQMTAAQKEAEEELDSFRRALSSLCPGSTITGELIAGEKEEVIWKSLNEHNPDVLLLVKKATHGLSSRLFEYISDVMNKAVCPVLIVPENLQYRTVNKIGFATQFADEDVDAISWLTKLASPLEGNVVVLNIYDSPAVMERVLSKEFETMVKEKTGYTRLEFVTERGPDPAKEIHDMIPEMNLDMLALSTRNRSVLQRLYNPGLTWKMISEGYLPILVFHRR